MARRACACGCDEQTAGGVFRPGHDQRLRSDLERRVGGLVALKSLVEAAEEYVAGNLSGDAFASKARGILPRRPSR
jgi:hypothetical protein